MILVMLLLVGAQAAPVVRVSPTMAAGVAALERLSPEGREVFRRSMAESQPIVARERESARRAEAAWRQIAAERTLDVARLRSALRARDAAEAAWRSRRTEHMLVTIGRLPDADRAIVASILPDIVAPPATR